MNLKSSKNKRLGELSYKDNCKKNKKNKNKINLNI